MHKDDTKGLNARVWDMVLNLVHPAALYVVFQLLILDRMQRTPAFDGLGPLRPISLGIYLLQFLGAWTVFYTTLLRDMELKSAWGTILLVVAVVGLVSQYLIFRKPEEASATVTWSFLGVQLGLAAVAWPFTFALWRRMKSKEERKEGADVERLPPPTLGLLPFLTLPQQLPISPQGQHEATDWFYDYGIWILCLVPLGVVILLAALKRKRTPELPQVTDADFESLVLDAGKPVLLHAYKSWSIGDRVVENQVVKLAALLQGRLAILWFDVEKNPEAVGLYPTLSEQCVALFQGRRIVWQAKGVHDHQTMLREIEPLIFGTPSPF